MFEKMADVTADKKHKLASTKKRVSALSTFIKNLLYLHLEMQLFKMHVKLRLATSSLNCHFLLV